VLVNVSAEVRVLVGAESEGAAVLHPGRMLEAINR
jgi:hypothetical protein